ncbi:hypothetical protein NDU88_000089 [Pleurodeles waltl]|uniref:Uncharacterized protein n=1 Tax=Pleurodeles waltl TaxID=8319 RepID=A0AAV7UR69_PLEWA|nr:hypothetical protein NDU88_000089 [Pleurodeles waltl]
MIYISRVPRGLRILVTPTYQNPHPKPLEEWLSLMAAIFKNMLGFLSKYEAIELEEITGKIRKLKTLFHEHGSKEEIEQLMAGLEKRLYKYEEEIETKKERKFLCDKIDYTMGKILTFGKKYDVAWQEWFGSG